VRASGFHDVRVEFKSPIAEAAKLQPAPQPADAGLAVADAVETFNENFAKLNARMFSYQDYAVVGRV
jgi:O-antigen chain-terminating methyltransferase